MILTLDEFSIDKNHQICYLYFILNERVLRTYFQNIFKNPMPLMFSFIILFFLIKDISSPKIRMEEKLPLISETFVNLICSATKINSSFYIVWKCGNVIYEKTTMENETFIWSTLKLKIDSTYNGIQCICKIHSKTFDFTVSDFVTLRVTSKCK